MSEFSASVDMLPGPAAFALYIFLMTILISQIVGRVTSVRRSVDAASMSDGLNGAGLFKSSTNYSTYLYRSSLISVIGLPTFFKRSFWLIIFLFQFLDCSMQLPQFYFSYGFFYCCCQIFHVFLLIDSDASFRSLVYFCVFGLCLDFLCSYLTVVSCCSLALHFSNPLQSFHTDPLVMQVLLTFSTSWIVEICSSLVPYQLISIIIFSFISKSRKAWNLLMRATLN